MGGDETKENRMQIMHKSPQDLVLKLYQTVSDCDPEIGAAFEYDSEFGYDEAIIVVFKVQKRDAQCEITLDGKSMTADHFTMTVQPTALKPKDDSAVAAGSTSDTTKVKYNLYRRPIHYKSAVALNADAQ